MTDRRLLLHYPDDNVLVLRQRIGAAERFEVGDEHVVAGRSLDLGHQDFILTYKIFEPVGPACLPAAE